jgi:hypothetical protein
LKTFVKILCGLVASFLYISSAWAEDYNIFITGSINGDPAVSTQSTREGSINSYTTTQFRDQLQVNELRTRGFHS